MGTLLVKVGGVDVEQIDDDRVCAHIKQNGQFEPQTLTKWSHLCSDGKAKCIIDVGSYGGLFGIAAVLMKNVAIAIEPNPIMVRRTKANQALNGVSYEVIQAGASDKVGKAMLGFNPNVRLTSGASLERKGPAMIEVQTLTLDGLLTSKKVGAIKIDVEGHEAAVIRGAQDLIKLHKPVLLIETMDNPTRKQEIVSLLPNYRVAGFLDNRNLWMEPK